MSSTIVGDKEVVRFLTNTSRNFGTGREKVAVVYQATDEKGESYAEKVHENVFVKHEIGQAKFLEQPARQNQEKYREIVFAFLNEYFDYPTLRRTGGVMLGALVKAAEALLADSQPLVPVDTGRLKESGQVIVTRI